VSTTTNSTSTSSGALVVNGGVGIANDVYIGGDLNVAGNIISSGIAAESYEALSVNTNPTGPVTNPDPDKTVTYYTITGGSATTGTASLANGSFIG
jgi:hypothetical protein